MRDRPETGARGADADQHAGGDAEEIYRDVQSGGEEEAGAAVF